MRSTLRALAVVVGVTAGWGCLDDSITGERPLTIQLVVNPSAASVSETVTASFVATGEVVETMNSGGYTYVKVATDEREIGAATSEFEVAVGDRVRRGQMIFEDRKTEGVRFTSPGAGEVVAINRGERRAFQSLVIELSQSEREGRPDGDDLQTFASYSGSEVSRLDRDQVRQGVGRACQLQPEARAWQPHITLARKAGRGLESGRTDPIDWSIRDFCLVESVTEESGPRYRILRRWPLEGQTGSM